MLSRDTGAQAELVRKLSILFVDDDVDIRESMSQYLSRRVGKVHTAQDGSAGIDSFMELHPDLVISDIRMGGMDGLTMCRKIRETEPELPVIFISAHNESEILLSSIDLGITKFIVKPVDTKVLMEAISGVALTLEQKRSLQNRLQLMDSIRDEADYDTECVKDYVSRYMEINRHDEFSNIKHLSIPKLEISGDFYSVAKHQDDLYVMLADGSGHGLSAVVPALQIPGIFKEDAEQGFSLSTIAAKINRSLHKQHFAEHFVTTTLLHINQQQRFIEILNCSNPPAFIFDDAGTLLHVCHSKAAALGMVGEEAFSVLAERFEMDRHVRIYIFTDGLFDTLQARFPKYGYAEFQTMLADCRSAHEFDALADKIHEAAQHCRADDITILEVHFDCKTPSTAQVELQLEPELPVEIEIPVTLNQSALLYVEDDDSTRENLARFLDRRMGVVHVAKDGMEGLALFRKYRPHLVLADIKMPHMSGLEMAKEIRKLDKDVPIILTSGSDSAEDAEVMFELGISRFHMKPLDTAKLTDAIQSCLRQSTTLNLLRLSASAFQVSSLAVVTVDADKRIVAINPSFSRITGYTQEELFGHNPLLLMKPTRSEAGLGAAMWHALDESGSWSGEMQCGHKNGATVSGWLTVNAVDGSEGGPKGYHFIFADLSQRQLNDEKMRKLMSYDSLTQLPNRVMFEGMVNQQIAQARQRQCNLALINIKLARFIEINNVFGVHVGDQVLLAVGQILLQSARDPDAVFRTDGVEFAVLMLEENGRESIERSVVDFYRALNQPISVGEQQIQLRANIGVSVFPSDGETYEELVKSASSAVNHAQLVGGNTYKFFEKLISEREVRQAILQQGIKSGLHKGEFFMLYQPKYSLSKQQVVGAEALVRWNHPTYGLISPVEFVPLGESSGAVIEMSEWIIDSVCAQLAEWRGRGLRQVPVSINISPLHFWRGDLVASLQNGLMKWDILPDRLTIEVTEGVMMDASERTMQILGQLKSHGFHLSIDDFGTGYSSLKYLKDMPISELKIDRSFIIEIPDEWRTTNLHNTAIPRAIIGLANEFELGLVAEGVETETQRDFLVENGCDVIQGYLFSRPVSPDSFSQLLS